MFLTALNGLDEGYNFGLIMAKNKSADAQGTFVSWITGIAFLIIILAILFWVYGGGAFGKVKEAVFSLTRFLHGKDGQIKNPETPLSM